MTNKKFVFINIIIGVIIFIIQYNGFFFTKNLDATPMLPLGFVIVLSMFSSELSSFIIGLCLGVAVDCLSTTASGFNTIFFSLACFLVSFITHYLFNNNIKSSLVLSFTLSFVFFAIRFLVFFPSVNINDTFTYFFKNAIPSALITAVISGVLYLVNKKIINHNRISR